MQEYQKLKARSLEAKPEVESQKDAMPDAQISI
jgi:hypothetical protein